MGWGGEDEAAPQMGGSNKTIVALSASSWVEEIIYANSSNVAISYYFLESLRCYHVQECLAIMKIYFFLN